MEDGVLFVVVDDTIVVDYGVRLVFDSKERSPAVAAEFTCRQIRISANNFVS